MISTVLYKSSVCPIHMCICMYMYNTNPVTVQWCKPIVITKYKYILNLSFVLLLISSLTSPGHTLSSFRLRVRTL